MMLALFALLAPSASADDQQFLSLMTTLYDEVCLKAFPDDKAVEAEMEKHDATELTREEMKATFGNDPGRAWVLQEGGSVWLEFPPYHACSVRWTASALGDL